MRPFRILAGTYPPDGPVLWCARRVFEGLGWAEGDEPEAVVAFGGACRDAVGLAGVLLSPPMTDVEFTDRLRLSDVPMLIVGASGDPSWSAAAAARLRTIEVLQIPRVNADFEIPGDVAGSIAVLGRLADRMTALVRRI